MAGFSSPSQAATRRPRVSAQWRLALLRLGALALMTTVAARIQGGRTQRAAVRVAVSQMAGPPTVHSSPKLGRVSTIERADELEAMIADGSDVLVKLTFPWCRPCRYFADKYQKLASIYKSTHFVRVSANRDEAMKRYAQELKIEQTPMFAAYSGGRLVATWTGANAERFVKSIEHALPTAEGKFTKATLAASRQ
eukprot:CAMPEP_0113818594 /NCGR_PEP_ID=MMETSP0328-20130328/318_1 /TAXON_ID=39455 /ORGANISM="Alexandrium minutum" /LENGTH=194 /DNA_ID=CAMNT_0000786529 /DNA_START=33 /DNA_END=617 /DNA_ORIENTATION=- /assembly_acc=CAM_ASM_000350